MTKNIDDYKNRLDAPIGVKNIKLPKGAEEVLKEAREQQKKKQKVRRTK